MKQYKGMGRVFSFTLIQQVRQKGWRTTTLLLALACLIIPMVSLTAAAQHQKNAAPDQNVTAWESYDQDVLDSAGLTSRQQELLTVRVDVSVTGGRTGEGQAADVLSMVLPFVSLMLLYFLVLLYGQGTAASVLLEKTSKLMDLFLVSVEPTAMVLGKVLATALAGLLQLTVWILSLMGGFAAGGVLARQTAPVVTLPAGWRVCSVFRLCWRPLGCCWQASCCIAVCPPSAAPWPGRSRICPAPTCCFPWCWWPASCAACSPEAWTA